MKRYLVLLVFMSATAAAYSQNNSNDNVFLNTLTYGENLEQIPNDNSFAYMRDENDDIQRRKIIRNKSKSYGEEKSKTGYIGRLEIGSQIDDGELGFNRLKLNFLNGYQFNPYLILSLGIGVRDYSWRNTLVPIFADIRGKFVESDNALYVSLGVGYSYDASNDYEGVGIYISPGIGYCIKTIGSSIFTIGANYEFQRKLFSGYIFNGYPRS